MPLTPTPYDELPDELKTLFNEIICAPGSKLAPTLRRAIRLLHPAVNIDRETFCAISDDEIFSGCCYDFVKYQINDEHTCNGDYDLFLREGFQIGSPWHGDIVQAPVMFISSNPAITQNCIFPRWHSGSGNFTLAGQDAPDSINYNDENTSNILNAPEEIYNFLRDRLLKAKTHPTGAGGSYAWTVNPDDKSKSSYKIVSFWRDGLRKIMNGLYPNRDKKNINNGEHTQGLMNAALSTEIIFWGSMKEAHAKNINTLNFFWEHFTEKIIKNSGAVMIFLVGERALETFKQYYGLNLQCQNVLVNPDKFVKPCIIAAVHAPNYHGDKDYDKVIAKLTDSQKSMITAKIEELY
ncbi:MAG: hypothetical protein IJP48_01550 [Synergistaceae bacterium]|nr:hypothetical protein [Synergistaceae bacterium]